VTETYDLESEPSNPQPYEHITPELLYQAAATFVGDIMQYPPIHSAIKKDGKRAYELAREGKDIQLDARPVTIGTFEITAIQLPEVHFRVECSTGTYIRSLANDFGQQLGCGGYLQALQRTKIGNFAVEDALSPQEWNEYWKNALL
jgi:tRNA pseudouridine55 synthase